jgi:hypothetical protein
MNSVFATDWVCDELPLEESKERTPRISFFKPSELRDFIPDEKAVLVGDCHIMRGEVFIIGGEPGVGKSTAATELAISGATGIEWLGLPVHAPFKTLIIQNENGRYRLSQEYKARGLSDEIDNRILVSEPPPFGMTLTDPEFLADVRQTIEEFRPEVVIFDPWNSAAKDDKAADYTSAFESLRALLPTGPERPALGIVAHTRKPQTNEKRTGGSGLMHLLAGSYVLSSVPRAIFVMVRGSHDETDNSVVFFNPKNSNGPCAPRSAWERSPSGFRWVPEFDWLEFDGDKGGRKTIRTEHLKEALGSERWSHPEAVKKLMEVSECGERACQNALKKGGKFNAHLIFEEEKVGYRL